MNRREFLHASSSVLAACTGVAMTDISTAAGTSSHQSDPEQLTLFLCGDVMTGRGIDQVLPHPGDPRIYESYMKSATGYVEIAESDFGPIPRPVSFEYIWGDALAELERTIWMIPSNDPEVQKLRQAVDWSIREVRQGGHTDDY